MIVYRLWDPIEGKFYARSVCGGWANPDYWYANNSNSFWTKVAQVKHSLSIAPPDIKDRLVIRVYKLIEVD